MKICGICGLCAVSLLVASAVFAQEEIVAEKSAVEYSASLMWDSKYVS